MFKLVFCPILTYSVDYDWGMHLIGEQSLPKIFYPACSQEASQGHTDFRYKDENVE